MPKGKTGVEPKGSSSGAHATHEPSRGSLQVSSTEFEALKGQLASLQEQVTTLTSLVTLLVAQRAGPSGLEEEGKAPPKSPVVGVPLRTDPAAAQAKEKSSDGAAGSGKGTTRRAAFRKARKALREAVPKDAEAPETSEKFRKAAQTLRVLCQTWGQNLSEGLGPNLSDLEVTVQECPPPIDRGVSNPMVRSE